MGIDEVRHLVADAVRGRDLVHRSLDVVTDARWGIEQHDALACGQEGGLVVTVRDPVEVPLHPSDVVPLLVDCRAKRRSRDARAISTRISGTRTRSGKSVRLVDSLHPVLACRCWTGSWNR